MKFLLTGATGLVGRHILKELQARAGHGEPIEVHALARRAPAAAGIPPSPNVTFHQCDLLDPHAAAAIIEAVRPTHLVHAAWTMEPGRVWWDPDNLAWVGATLMLARRFTEAGGRRMVAVGTCAEYDWSFGTCTEDHTPLHAATLYGASKNATRLALESYAGRAGLSLCWARLFNMYGPHEDERRLVAGAIAALRAGKPFPSSDGRQLRDFMHVADIAAALVALAFGPVEGAINVASGLPVSVEQVLATVAATIGQTVARPGLLQLGTFPRAPNDPDRLLADVARLHATGWRPRLGLQEGVAATVDWWQNRPGPT